jgi:hypothetical protein
MLNFVNSLHVAGLPVSKQMSWSLGSGCSVAQSNSCKTWRSAVARKLAAYLLAIDRGERSTGILLGSMGMEIHFSSKAVSYVAMASTILILIACVAVGFRLRRRSGP